MAVSGRNILQGSIAVVGAGNWGTSLLHALRASGITVSEVIVRSAARRSPAARRLSDAGLTTRVTTLERAELDAAVIWLCVPDSAIQSTARRLVERAARGPSQLRGQMVVHSSGALNSEILDAAARSGASVGSVHPLMSFPTRAPVPLLGVPFAVEGEPAVRRKLNRIVRCLGGKPFPIAASEKALYHAVGVLASPLLLSLLAAAQQTAVLAGLTPGQGRRLIAPIARATVENFFSKGPARSFSGPLARGDVATVRLHLAALAPHPILDGIYRSLARSAMETLPVRRRAELRRLLFRSRR